MTLVAITWVRTKLKQSEQASNLYRVVTPAALVGSLCDVGLQLRRQLGQVQEDVLGSSQHWGCASQLALGVDQVCGVQ